MTTEHHDGDRQLQSVPGLRIGVAAAGLKKSNAKDVAVFAFDRPASTAAVFTRNRFVAAPVTIARQHLAAGKGKSSAWVINAGNANCGTGSQGLTTADASCAHVGSQLGLAATTVIPFSTGVIMETLPWPKLKRGITTAMRQLNPAGWAAAAAAIMTTDTVIKGASVSVKAGQKSYTITGIAKGSGMIHPDMATMLAFIATDATVPARMLRPALQETVAQSFNTISVDGDTSTNDAVIIAATGHTDSLSGTNWQRFRRALHELSTDLANQIVADGEGATCTATVTVRGLATSRKCRAVADAIACSPLVKTMLHARDPNLGRLLMAIGKAGVELDPTTIDVRLNGTLACKGGCRATGFTEAKAQRSFARQPVLIEIQVGKRQTVAQVTFCDLSADYIRINSNYRS